MASTMTVPAEPRLSSARLARRAADLWWLHPARIVLLGLVPLYLSFLAFDYTRVVQNVYVPSHLYLWGIALMLTMVVGVQTALAHTRADALTAPPRISRGLMLGMLAIVIAAYAIWFGPLLARPQLLLEILARTRAEVRDEISTVPGITTFTQFGVAYVIAYAIKSGAGVQPVSRLEHAGFIIVLLLAVLRAFAWAERLALIELLACFAVARLAYLPIYSPRRWTMASIAPLLAPLVLYLLFTASEVNRSWIYYQNQYASVWHFTFDRLLTYYATAANNGIGVLVDTFDWPVYRGAYAFEWAYNMPGLGKLLDAAFGDPRHVADTWLATHARPEFNSPTAYFRVLFDFGYFGSALYFLLLGYLIGRAYSGFRRGHLFGLLAFPVFFLFLIESLRYSYLAETRIVPLTVGLALIALDVRRLRQRAAGMPLSAAAAPR